MPPSATTGCSVSEFTTLQPYLTGVPSCSDLKRPRSPTLLSHRNARRQVITYALFGPTCDSYLPVVCTCRCFFEAWAPPIMSWRWTCFSVEVLWRIGQAEERRLGIVFATVSSQPMRRARVCSFNLIQVSAHLRIEKQLQVLCFWWIYGEAYNA